MISQPGDLEKGMITPREFDFGGQWDLVQNLPRTGETDSWRAQTKACEHQDPGERSSDPQTTAPDFPVSVQASPAEGWVMVACCRAGDTECSSVCMDPFEGGRHYLHDLHDSLVSNNMSNNREGTQPCPPTENWIKYLLSMALPIRTRPTFPHSQSLPSGSFHKPLILIPQRADRMKSTITEN